MIGFYDYTVLLTYVGMLCAVFGMFQAIDGHYVNTLFCLGGALLCDTFDGRVARRKPDRTKGEMLFGMQIDSLCDLVSFGALPAVLCYCMGLRDRLGLLAIGYYCLCCVIRLGYFNVMELTKEEGAQTVYHGLPAIGLSMLLPTVCMVRMWIPEGALFWLLRGLLAAIGTLYILDFRISKPKLWMLLVLGLIFWIPVAVLCFHR